MAGIIISESSGRLNSLYGNFQAPIASCIEERVEAWKVKEIGPKIFKERKSTNFAEGYTGLTAMGDWAPVGENGAHPTADFQEAYSKILTNVTWKSMFAISREMKDDNKIGDMMQRATKMTDAYYRTRERHFARLLGTASQGTASFTQGGQTFATTSADADVLFSTSHTPKVSGADQTNMYTNALDADKLAAVMTAMQQVKGDNGEVLGLNPDTLIIPNVAALKKTAFTIVGSLKEPGTADNDYNYLFGNLSVLVWPYLNEYIGATNTAPWFIMDSSYNESSDGGIFQNRVDLEVTSRLGTNDENIWDGYARFAAGFIDWRFIMGGGLSGGTTLS